MVPQTKNIMRLLNSFCNLSNVQRKLLLEASLYLIVIRLVLVFIPFKYISLYLNKEITKYDISGEKLIPDIVWAINKATKFLPVRLVCFPRGIATYIIMRKCGLNAQLFYGVSHIPNENLEGHVWVMYKNTKVIGCEQIENYTILMSYPFKKHNNKQNHLDS